RLKHEAAWCSTFSCLRTPQAKDSAGFQCLQNPGVQKACEENLVDLKYAVNIVLMFEEEEKA
ncbi:hypothetical protein T265_14258, partial [Opisthorchis viverrini]